MDLGLGGRIALLVGPDDALRAACADALAAEGATVVVGGHDHDPDDDPAVDIVVAHGSSNPGSTVLDVASAAELHAAWDSVVDTLDVFRRCSESMARRGWGRLVWVGSAGSRSLDAGDDQLDAMVTLAMRATNKVVAGELGPGGVTANAVLRSPAASLDEVAATVAFVCSEGAGYLTGVTITVDGGDGSAMF